MFATPASDGAIESKDFIDAIYDVPGVDDAIDIVGVHPYGPDLDAVTAQLDGTRKAIDDAGDDAGTWVTEIGWGSDPAPPSDLAKTPDQQADLLSTTLETLYDGRDDLGPPRRGTGTRGIDSDTASRGLRMVRDGGPARCRPRQQAGLDRVHRSDRRHALSRRRRVMGFAQPPAIAGRMTTVSASATAVSSPSSSRTSSSLR